MSTAPVPSSCHRSVFAFPNTPRITSSWILIRPLRYSSRASRMATAALARASSSIIVVNARPFHPCTSGVRPFGLGLTAARFFVALGPRHLANTTARQAAGVPQRPWPRSSAGARRFSLVARWMMHDLAEIGLARAPLPHRHTVCKAHTVALCLRTIPSTRPRGLCTGASVRRAPAQHAARSTMCPIQLPDSPNSNCAGPPANGIRWSRSRRALRKRVKTRCLFFLGTLFWTSGSTL